MRRVDRWVRKAMTLLDDPARTDQALALLRRANNTTGGADPDVTAFLLIALSLRYARMPSTADLDEAIAVGRAAPPDAVATKGLLAAKLYMRYSSTGRQADLGEAIDVGRLVAEVYPEGELGQAGTLANLSMSLLARFERTVNPADVDESIRAGRRAVQAATADDPDRETALSSLGNALTARARPLGDLDDAAVMRILDEATAIMRTLAEGTTPDNPGRCMYLSNLGTVLHMRYGHTHDLADLEEAIEAGRESVAATPVWHPNRAIHLLNLGNTLEDQRGHDSDELIAIRREALHSPSPHTPRMLSQLSRALTSRWEGSQDPGDLEEAIEATRAALAATPPGHPDRAGNLARLGFTLWPKVEVSYSADEIREAIKVCREAASSLPDDADPDHRGRILGTLAGTLYSGFQRTGDLGYLEESITAGHDAVALVRAGHPARPLYLSALGEALRARYWRTGAFADIDQAIAYGQEAAQEVTDDRSKTMVLGNLGAALTVRHGIQGGQEDLDEGIAALQVAAGGEGDNGALSLSNLGSALVARFERNGGMRGMIGTQDLEEGVRVCREALARVPEDHPFCGACLVNLSSALQTLSQRTANLGGSPTMAELDERVEVARAAAAAIPLDHPRAPSVVNELARALRDRFDRTGDLVDADEAVDAARAAVESVPADHFDRCSHLHDLSRILWTRFERTRKAEDAAGALDGWREAVALPDAPPMTRLYAAHSWGYAAASGDQWALAAEGYARAVELMPLTAWHGLSREDREHWLDEFRGLGGDAAACAIAAGQPERALELLEAARGVIWSQLLDTRTDLAALRAASPELAEALDQARTALDAHHSRRAAARRWDELVEQARSLPGFDAFLRPPTAGDLRAAAAGGPVVVVNIGHWRCDAIVLRGDDSMGGRSGGVTVVPLPAITQQAAWDQAFRYLEAAESLEDGPLPLTALIEAEAVIADVLSWLWDTVAAPVLDELGYTADLPGDVSGDGPWRRIWWCPCGPLALLPVHAAGSPEPDRPSVMNRVVSSYTPTLRALVQARAATPEPEFARLLVVAMSRTPGAPDLPFVEHETSRLTTIFPGDRHLLLSGSDATRDTVRRALPANRWAHFSCHGGQDLFSPSDAGILVHDGVVTVSDLTADGAGGGEWAFLSACKTASGTLRATDEAITLVSALLYAGWRHVVGTLWTVVDDTTAQIAGDVYDRLTPDGRFATGQAAVALHLAVSRVRAAEPYRPSLWAPFVHGGL